MPDLTTMHLKCLLEKATPEPWVKDWDNQHVLFNPDTDRVVHVEYSDDARNIELIAAAPLLAQEVIRLREHIEGLITTMENKAGVSNGRDTLQELIVAENLMSAANQLRQILGDHDE
ncbi:hypothetical protein ACKFR5_03025 [Corynebacterium marquesiae]|uniref:hypothetical protein n=1 Tax=Corynebacterium marquesiae TaxID=2913503 RepID=UPI0038D1F0F2